MLTTLVDPDPDEAILRWLIDLPGIFLPHSGTTQFHHLLGTYRILKFWGCDDDVCLAGLFHSAYGTRAYQRDPLSPGQRVELRRLIGSHPEQLVKRFARIDWAAALADTRPPLSQMPGPLITLAAANFLEQAGRLAAMEAESFPLQQACEQYKRLLPHLAPHIAANFEAGLEYVRRESAAQ